MSYSTFDHKGYEVKNVKTFDGRQGVGTSSTLYKDGKKIGMVLDEANGGCYHFQISQKDMAQLTEDIKDLPPFHDEEIHYDFNLSEPQNFIMFLWNDKTLEKSYKRQCKNKTLFKMKGEPDKLYTLKTPFNDVSKDWVESKYGADKVEFINEMIS